MSSTVSAKKKSYFNQGLGTENEGVRAVLHRLKGQKSLSDKAMFEQTDECSEKVGKMGT